VGEEEFFDHCKNDLKRHAHALRIEVYKQSGLPKRIALVAFVQKVLAGVQFTSQRAIGAHRATQR